MRRRRETRKRAERFERRITEARFKTILDSLTADEMEHPQLLLVGSRACRIARGSGSSPLDVKRLAKAMLLVKDPTANETMRELAALLRQGKKAPAELDIMT